MEEAGGTDRAGDIADASSRRHGPVRRQASLPAGLDPCFEPLVAFTRGGAVESLHRGVLAVVDLRGALLGGIGDPYVEVLLRSAAKPFQAAAGIAAGVAEAFSLTDEEIAVIAASHSGAPEHVRVVEGLLERAEVPASALVCGPLEHNCSGKHAGMLLLARRLGVAPEGYERPEHPVQKEIARYLGSLLDSLPRRSGRRLRVPAAGPLEGPVRAEEWEGLFAGADGCGVPVIRATVYEAAWLYAALAAGLTPPLARVRDAMLAHPHLVAGEERLDTRVMRAAAGRAVSKAGAEGVQGLGLAPASDGGAGSLGCALKIEDGSGRAIPALVALLLRTWGSPEASESVAGDYPSVMPGAGGAAAGAIEVVVAPEDLRWPGAAQGSGAGGSADGGGGEARQGGLRLSGKKEDHLTRCRGDEKEVLRFLREQWPSVDVQVFGQAVDWSAEPFCLVFRREKKIAGVLRGHFIGGLASVDELMVRAGDRGAGLGSLLLGRFEDEARGRRCKHVVLRAVKGSAAEDFYRQRGYYRESVQRGYEFGYDYVRLVCDVEHALGEPGRPAQRGKGA